MDITLIATADWDHSLWTNKQHVAKELAALGHRVLYVESLGLRPPRSAARDWRRILKRLTRAFSKPRPIQPGLWVWSPLVIPAAGSIPFLRWLNRQLFGPLLRKAERTLGLHRQLLWTYNPCILDYLSNAARDSRLVYHCVDDIQSQPGMNAEWITRSERRLCHRADFVFVTSPTLLESRRPWSRRIHYYPNVVDFSHFSTARSEDLAVASALLGIPSPRLGFVGALSAYKVDLDLIASLAARRKDWSFVLIGPTGEGEQAVDLSPLLSQRNLHWLGVQPYHSLPAFLKGLDVALLPLLDNAYTQSMFPMKFFEYLAAGLPVVASPIRCLQAYADVAVLPASNDPSVWESAIMTALNDTPTQQRLRMACAEQNTYRRRTLQMLAQLESLPAS